MSSPFLAVSETENPVRASIADTVEECFVRTAEALFETGSASHTEISHALVAARKAYAEDEPVDLLESLARVLGHIEEQLNPVIAALGEAVASTLPQAPPLIPFAGKLIAPSAFYESYDHIRLLGRDLMTPLLYAEDADAVGVGSINPIAAQILSEEVISVVNRRLGVRPFVTIARLDYESWAFLNRKHFAR